MESRWLQHDAFVVVLLQEMTDPNGKHLEYRDMQGTVFAKMAKVYHKGGLFNLFPKDNHVHGELKDGAGELLLLTTSYQGATPRERKVEVNRPDGALLATLYDAPWGADFEAPDGTVLGKARRPEDASLVARVFNYTYTDATGQAVGTCERHYPDRDTSVGNAVWELLSLSVNLGRPVDVVTLQPPIDPLFHTMLFLFPALQHLRFTHNG